jgi:hypothetical protein
VRLANKKKKKLAPYKALNQLRGKVWKQVSIFVRAEGADDWGYVRCFTCPKKDHWRTMDCGHFKHGVLDYDLENLKPQCAGCNRFWHGRLDVYATRLIEKYGPDILNAWKTKRKTTNPKTR